VIDFKFQCPLLINDLSRNKKGLYCKACDKQILDLRQKSSVEIADIVRESTEDVCGVLSTKMIQSPLVSATTSRFQFAFLFVFYFGFTAMDVYGQAETDTISRAVLQHGIVHTNCLSGRVVDFTGEAVVFAKVILTQGETKFYAVSDFDGYFQLKFTIIEGECLSLECRAIMHETIRIQDFQWSDHNEALKLILPVDDSSVLSIGIFIIPQEDGIKPPSNPYDFNKTTINQNDLNHRP
jgi:hypothetical protein